MRAKIWKLRDSSSAESLSFRLAVLHGLSCPLRSRLADRHPPGSCRHLLFQVSRAASEDTGSAAARTRDDRPGRDAAGRRAGRLAEIQH
jgi:hypothetical protein